MRSRLVTDTCSRPTFTSRSPFGFVRLRNSSGVTTVPRFWRDRLTLGFSCGSAALGITFLSGVSGFYSGVTAWMRLHPAPGGFDDHAQILILRLPAKLAFDFVGTGDQDRWIAGATWSNPHRDIFAGDLPRGFDHFEDAVAVAAATEVVDPATGHRVECEYVRASEIDHVDVVAQAGAVRCRVIVAVDLYVRTFSCRRLQSDGNDVRLGIVIFTAILAGARRVEVTQ